MVFSEKYSGTTTSQKQSGQTFARQHNPNYREGRPKRKVAGKKLTSYRKIDQEFYN
jgi:hypothetical protein